jgi:hypothetical protein
VNCLIEMYAETINQTVASIVLYGWFGSLYGLISFFRVI